MIGGKRRLKNSVCLNVCELTTTRNRQLSRLFVSGKDGRLSSSQTQARRQSLLPNEPMVIASTTPPTDFPLLRSITATTNPFRRAKDELKTHQHLTDHGARGKPDDESDEHACKDSDECFVQQAYAFDLQVVGRP